MSKTWVQRAVEETAQSGPEPGGTILFLGGTDTGKSTLLTALGRDLAKGLRVAVVDADIGQSHIGPPTTVGWALMEQSTAKLVDLPAKGIAFVGDITPLGHLLQLTAGIVTCVRSAVAVADVVLIDTPGLVHGPTASVLWWTVQTVLRPQRIVAIQRDNELRDLLAGLQTGLSRVEQVTSAPQIPSKSPEQRRNHRNQVFMRYFRNARVYNVALDGVAVRTSRTPTRENVLGRIVGLSDAHGADLAIGVIEHWQPAGKAVAVRAPELDPGQIRCVTVGDAKSNPMHGRS